MGCESREKNFLLGILKDPHKGKTLNSLVIKVDHANKHNSINLLPSGNAIKCSMKQGIAPFFMCTLFFNPSLFVTVSLNRHFSVLTPCQWTQVNRAIKTVKGNWVLEH